MDFSRLARMVPLSARRVLSDKLVDFVLTSKNDDKMPSALAKTILHYWRQSLLEDEHGLAALLEASVLLEPEKTVATLSEQQLVEVAEEIRAEMKP